MATTTVERWGGVRLLRGRDKETTPLTTLVLYSARQRISQKIATASANR